MRTYVLSIVMVGDLTCIENNVDMVLSSIDYVGLDSVEIVVRNESEVVDG